MKQITLIIAFAMFIITGCRKAILSSTSGSAPAIPWNDSSSQHPRNEIYTNLINKYNKLGLPGISLLIQDKFGTWIGAAGKADIQENIDFAPAQVSKAASVTKLMIGALVFKLMEDSVNTHLTYSDLDKPISKWLPTSTIDRIPNGNKVTFGQLLNHESGIPDVSLENDFYLAVLNSPNRLWTPDELISFIHGTRAEFSPGDTAIYSNTNTLLASMILDRITNRTHAQLLRDYLLAPLGLDQTFYHPQDKLPDYTAQGYYDLYRNHTLINVSNFMIGNGCGYNGIFSSVPDLHKFLDALLIRKSFLTSASLQLMMRTGKSDGSNRYGYGIMKKFIERGEDAGWGHSGRDLGYTANLLYFPETSSRPAISHSLLINYGTDADSFLKETFRQFQNELLDITLN